MPASRFICVLCCLLFALKSPERSFASAFVRGAYYRLGDDDPGALPGTIGNDPTEDSFGDDLDLSRFGSPRYSADVPTRGPWESKISMAFANQGLGGPAFPGFYGRDESLSMVEQGYALEAWVKRGPSYLDLIQTSLLAYNGQPDSNGFGLFLDGEDYVVRIGEFQRVLGHATVGRWHHLAYVQSLGTASYYFDGKLVHETSSDPLPVSAKGGFWLGGMSAGDNDEGALLFNGWMDEVRYQSFNPLAAGSFDPLSFLIRDVPGDFNADGVVDAADYVAWRRTDGTAEGYSAWRSDFGLGESANPGGLRGTTAAVPEPAAWLLAVLAISGAIISRRR